MGGMTNVVVKVDNQTIHCYGDWQWDSNCLVVFEDEFGELGEEIYADGGKGWQEVAEKIVDAMPLCLILELQAC